MYCNLCLVSNISVDLKTCSLHITASSWCMERIQNFLRAPSDCAAASSSPAGASGTRRVRGRRRAAGLPAAPPRAEAPSCAASRRDSWLLQFYLTFFWRAIFTGSCCARVSDVFKHIWPHCCVGEQIALNYLVIIPSFAWHVEVFGSLRKWLYLSTSDIDVSISISSSSLDF